MKTIRAAQARIERGRILHCRFLRFYGKIHKGSRFIDCIRKYKDDRSV